MKKVNITLIFTIIIALFPFNIAHAAINSQYVQSHGFNSSADGYQVHWATSISQVNAIKWSNDSAGLSRTDYDDPSSGGVYLRCNGSFSWQYLNSSGSVLATDSITVSGVKSPSTTGICGSGDGGGGGDNGSGGGDGSHCGCVFNTPGWQDYMGKVDQIIGKIPSPPNWDEVAGKFSDKIVPRFLTGMDSMLGRAPDLPNVPRSPGDLDDGNIKKPTGNLPGDFDGFDDNDIKDNADTIEEREDDSGGFDILNPIENLPDRDEFEHIPKEPENPTPEGPEESDNITPEPEEPENETPFPEEPENEAPFPEEPENETPFPKEPDNPTPTPGESDNEVPSPSEPGNNWYPMPGGGGGQAPVPGGNIGDAPMPGNSPGSAPMPGENNSKAPMPGGGG